MPGRILHDLEALWHARGCADEFIGTLVNAWIDLRGEAWGIPAGRAYVDVVAAGLAAETLRAVGRVLGPGGTVVVFNLAYGCDEAEEIRLASTLAREIGFDLTEAATGLFESWDGRLLRFRRS